MRIVGGVAKLLAWSVILAGVAFAQETVEAPDTFDWQFQPPIGLSGRYTTFTRLKSSQNIPALAAIETGAPGPMQRTETDEWTTLLIDREMISRDLKGNMVSRLTYRGFTQNQTRKIDGKLVSLPDTSRLPTLERLFGGLQIDIKHAPDGRVLNIIGLDIMQRRLSRALDKYSATDAALIKARFAKFCDETELRRVWDDSELRPKTLLRVGEGWNYQRPLALPIMKSFEQGSRRLMALNGNLATVSDQGNVSLAMDDAMSAQDLNADEKTRARIKISGAGTQAGTSVINRETGMEIDTYFTRRLALVSAVKLAANGQTYAAKLPQWYSWQTHRVFRANSHIESIE